MATLKILHASAAGEVLSSALGSDKAELTVENFHEDDIITFCAEAGSFVWAQIGNGMKESLLYVPKGKFSFPIPSGERKSGFAADAFEGRQTIVLRTASKTEIAAYRNLALNPLDVRLQEEVNDPDAPEWSNPTDSCAVLNGKIDAFPHAYANRTTRNEGCFFSRNAIDGCTFQGGHGVYPYHSWGGAVHEDLSLTVYFGRMVLADNIALYLRSDFSLNEQGQEHDTYWHTAVIEFSDGEMMEIKPIKTGDAQYFPFPQKKTEWVKLQRLDPYHTDKSQNFAALNQIEIWGRDIIAESNS